MDRLSISAALARSPEAQTCRRAVAPLPRTAPPRPDGRASLSPDPASPAARDPRGCSSPFPRRASLRRRLRPRENAATLLRGARACLALLAAAALLALAAPAQAQTEVWTATLTPGDLNLSILGCGNHIDSARCSSTTVLSEDSFNYDSTDYTITKLFVRSGGHFQLDFDADITTATAALTLVVGSTSLVLADADTIASRQRIWHNSGVSLTEGTDIVVKLTAPAADNPPTAANNTVTTGEDRPYTFMAADFSFMDADAGAALASVKIVTVPAAGILALDGTAVTVNGVVTKAQIDADMLTFRPAQDAHGVAYTTFTFKVNDGTVDSASAYTMTIDVTDAPPPVCVAPSFGDRREIWTGTVTVGAFVLLGTVTAYGYEAGNVGGLLPAGTFSIGSDNFTMVGIAVRTSGVPVFTFQDTSLITILNPTQKAALRLHVCDVDYDFSAAGRASSNFSWTGSLDWSDPVVTRTVYLSLPANNAATGEPTITGTAQAGQVLTADASPILDTDGLTGVDFTYQWVRVDADGTSNEEDITGEIAATYTLTDDDEGKKIKVKVSFTDELSGVEMRTSEAYPSSGTVTAAGTNNAPVFSSSSVVPRNRGKHRRGRGRRRPGDGHRRRRRRHPRLRAGGHRRGLLRHRRDLGADPHQNQCQLRFRGQVLLHGHGHGLGRHRHRRRHRHDQHHRRGRAARRADDDLGLGCGREHHQPDGLLDRPGQRRQARHRQLRRAVPRKRRRGLDRRPAERHDHDHDHFRPRSGHAL